MLLLQEPSTKRSKLVSRVTSLANLLPPVKTTPLKRIGQTLQVQTASVRKTRKNPTSPTAGSFSQLTFQLFLQRSISFRNVSQPEAPPQPPPSSSTMKTRVISATVSNPSSSQTAARAAAAANPAAKRRDSRLWSETFDICLGATQPLSPKEIKRQEVRGSLAFRLFLRGFLVFIFLLHALINNYCEI